MYDVFARTKEEGVEPDILWAGEGGGGSIFLDFVRTSFIDVPQLQ